MAQFDARKWVENEVDSLVDTYTDSNHTPTHLEQAKFLRQQLSGTAYLDELTESQRDEAFKACHEYAVELVVGEKLPKPGDDVVVRFDGERDKPHSGKVMSAGGGPLRRHVVFLSGDGKVYVAFLCEVTAVNGRIPPVNWVYETRPQPKKRKK